MSDKPSVRKKTLHHGHEEVVEVMKTFLQKLMDTRYDCNTKYEILKEGIRFKVILQKK